MDSLITDPNPELEELMMSNFNQVISTGNMSVALGEILSNGYDGSDLIFRLKLIKQFQCLFNSDSQSGYPNIEILERLIFLINTLQNDYRIDGRIQSQEAIILPSSPKTIVIQGGGFGGVDIDDNVVSRDSTWSSLKISEFIENTNPGATFEYIIPSATGILNV